MILSPRFEEALKYAAQVHNDQYRKGTRVPYVSHVLAVAALVLEHGGTEDEAIGALLHDAVEDCGVTVEELHDRFGAEVAAIVAGCSDSFSSDRGEKAPWLGRKQAYLAHLATASPSVLLVSAADKIHNARAILADYRVLGESLWSRFKGGRDDTLWYYRSLVSEFRKRGHHPALVAELARVVGELDAMVPKADERTGHPHS